MKLARLNQMQAGRRYEVIHQDERQRYPRRSVLVFLERQGWDYIFSARPLFGACRLARDSIISAEPVLVFNSNNNRRAR